MTAPRTSHPESSAGNEERHQEHQNRCPDFNDALAALLIAVAPVKPPAARKAAMKSALAQLEPKADHTRVSTLRVPATMAGNRCTEGGRAGSAR